MLSAASRLVREREKKMIDSLVAAYRQNDLTDQQAREGIANIAVLRALLADLEREDRN